MKLYRNCNRSSVVETIIDKIKQFQNLILHYDNVSQTRDPYDILMPYFTMDIMNEWRS